uniref:Uncharacterized protein n=1 Tax=Arundo donax TaxID=35708 RepID=A0A0A8Z9W6_ARUDO
MFSEMETVDAAVTQAEDTQGSESQSGQQQQLSMKDVLCTVL